MTTPTIDTYNADCEQWIREEPDNAVDCVLLDPPLNWQYLDGLIFECMRVSSGPVVLMHPLAFHYEGEPRALHSISQIVGEQVHPMIPLDSPLGGGRCVLSILNVDEHPYYFGIDSVWVDVPTDKQHAGTKPPELIERLLAELNLYPSSTILDPFMGSGSFGVAVVNCGHHYIGIENVPHWYELATARVNACEKEG